MKGYSFLCQYQPKPSELPAFYQPGFFFNEPRHLHQQTTGPFYVLSALNRRTGRAEARCAFFVDADQAISPATAPFGSVEFAEILPESVLDAFIQTLVNAVRAVGALTTLRLVNYPNCYAPEQAARLSVALLRHGFQRIEAHQTFFLPITPEPFEQTIVAAERRRLRKCREAGFRADHWPLPNIARVVAFLEETRRQQGYALTLLTERLTSLLQTFPEQFVVFTVRDDAQLAALTVAVRVRSDILYNFLPASPLVYRPFSPMVMLLDEVVAYCRRQNIRVLDLGTSLDGDHQPKASLMRFKRNLGAQESPKPIFEKRL